MKFKLKGSSRSGLTTSLTLHEKQYSVNKDNLRTTVDVHYRVDEDENGNLTLVVIWVYKVISGSYQILETDSESEYEIADSETEPLIEDLEQMIIYTFQRIRETVAFRKKEFTFLDFLGDIPADTILPAVRQLMKVLLPLYENSLN